MHTKNEYDAINGLIKSSKTAEGVIIHQMYKRLMRLEDRIEKLENKNK